MMKPYQILIFFISVVIVLFSLSLVFPKDGVRISDEISLKFFSFNELVKSDSLGYADISEIIQNASVAESNIDTLAILEAIANLMPYDTVGADPDSLRKITHLIEFPGGDKSGFDAFFLRLENLSNKKELIRILHYGDSQIETDRMTGFIRNKLQKRFGGSGPGMIPPVPLYKGKMSVVQKYSNDWERYTGFSKVDTTRGHKKYGALVSYCSFDSSTVDSSSNPYFEFQPSRIAYRTSEIYNRISLYFSKPDEESLSIHVYEDDSIIDVLAIEESILYDKITWNLTNTPKKFKLEFAGKSQPEIYAISLDNSWGIAMDNIPLRGSAGLVFSKIDSGQLKQMYDDMNVGMIILQFGGNVVPYMKNFERYEKFLKRELKLIKSLCPEAAILVVGPSDMSMRDKGKYVSYPSVEKVRDAMRKASLDMDCAFWDMYEAMGGNNSMPSWVFADPSLAISDFVHFNSRGAKIMAEMLNNAFMYEYNLWEGR